MWYHIASKIQGIIGFNNTFQENWRQIITSDTVDLSSIKIQEKYMWMQFQFKYKWCYGKNYNWK